LIYPLVHANDQGRIARRPTVGYSPSTTGIGKGAHYRLPRYTPSNQHSRCTPNIADAEHLSVDVGQPMDLMGHGPHGVSNQARWTVPQNCNGPSTLYAAMRQRTNVVRTARAASPALIESTEVNAPMWFAPPLAPRYIRPTLLVRQTSDLRGPSFTSGQT
jgi:hypothetical protein